ncbi:MAG: GGDEF domain-containing protein [Pseudomonadota bacterium]
MSLNMTANILRRPMPLRELRALRAANASAELEQRRQQAILRLARQLPSALEIEPMLMMFASSVQGAIPFDGLRFDGECPGAFQGHQHVFWGEDARNHAEYRLSVNDEPMGRMTFMRDRPFSGEELEVCEDLLAYLLYPLRNAMLYQHTLKLATVDPLTGIGNRLAFDQALARELARLERHGGGLSLMLLDMDGFKQVNDAHGHPVGDALLKQFAGVLSATARATDMVFRFGGDEFAILMPETGEDGALRMMERLREVMSAAPLAHGNLFIPLRGSMGVAHWMPGEGVSRMIERADAALYEDKRQRRQVVAVA